MSEGTVEHGESSFAAADGSALYYQWWRPGGAALAAVASLHGFGAHSDHETAVAEYLAPRGYACYGLDLRGHGRSAGRRGDVAAWSLYRDDLRAFLGLIEGREGAVPRFLLGVSAGGVIALDYVLHPPEPGGQGLRGVAVQAPPLGQLGVSPLKVAAARLLARVWPTFTLDTETDPAAISRDPAAVRALRTDPLWFSKATVRYGAEFLAAVTRIQARAAELATPLLILHGTADRVALPDGSRRFFARVGHADKELREYDGGYHNLFLDTDAPTVLADLEGWLARHTDQSVGPRLTPDTSGRSPSPSGT
jgi:alpha-beta hydrolase superfamily lysophospholipase